MVFNFDMKFYMVTIRNGLRVRLRVQGVNNYRKSIDVLGTLKNEHIFMFVLKLVLGNPIVQKMDLKTVLTIFRDTRVSNGPQTCSDPSFYQYLGSYPTVNILAKSTPPPGGINKGASLFFQKQGRSKLWPSKNFLLSLRILLIFGAF